MTEEELRQEILQEMEDIAPSTLEEVLHLIKKRKQEELEEDIRESHAALKEEGSIPWAELKKELELKN
ncbi:hypothetical protein WA1_12345 [Scytonema hofmannii PCC 7110]|uniref:Uncharacterized protein n=1 Tax=Scytonema hofmannii PCC 7110 TaxID=128403 RepID=A0A139XDX8_9CYAN|nr:hypothetical protein [Scytonema hofmannii]KYC42901.1 hypothetical protein WA1_12345 [Scytonema hofmannii PCC 7110]